MKTIDLTAYLPNVTCPYCNHSDGGICSSRRLEHQELFVFQRCPNCDKVWQELWTLTAVEVAESQDEEKELGLLNRHPE